MKVTMRYPWRLPFSRLNNSNSPSFSHHMSLGFLGLMVFGFCLVVVDSLSLLILQQNDFSVPLGLEKISSRLVIFKKCFFYDNNNQCWKQAFCHSCENQPKFHLSIGFWSTNTCKFLNRQQPLQPLSSEREKVLSVQSCAEKRPKRSLKKDYDKQRMSSELKREAGHRTCVCVRAMMTNQVSNQETGSKTKLKIPGEALGLVSKSLKLETEVEDNRQNEVPGSWYGQRWETGTGRVRLWLGLEFGCDHGM